MGDEAAVDCGPFRLTEPIGEGGMGVVYGGHHRRDGTRVAVKIMTSDLARQQEYKQEFRREVQAMARLNHPAVARVVDYGSIAEEIARPGPAKLVEGAPWFAMEYVDGGDLVDVASDWKWPRVRQALLVLLDALAHAHASDIIHRDLKPSNILVPDPSAENLEVKLVDFGIAHVFGTDDEEASDRAPDTWGTPEVMAPEQILGKWRDQGPWTDLYQLGCVAWWLITRRVPFDGDERSDVYLKHMSGEKGRFLPAFEVPDGVERWLERMLATDRKARFRRAADAAYALVRVAQLPGMSGEEFEYEGRETEEIAPDSLQTLGSVSDEIDLQGGPAEAGGAASAEDASLLEEYFQTSTPPIPDDWERAEPAHGDLPARGTGLALFDLRKIPVVDREAERDRLWRCLQMVRRTQQPAAVLLRGPAGSGKSRLVEWLARRGHELGALTTLQATHSPKGGPRDGLGSMFARHFRCTGLTWSEGFERVQDIYESLGFERASSFHDAVGLTRMMGLERDTEAMPPGFQNPNEKHYALRRLLARLASRRPVLLWLDDVPWGWESTRFAEFLLEEAYVDELPLYVVMTARDGAIDSQPRVRRMLDNIRDHEFGWDVPVRPLDAGAHRELVERMLHLEGELVDEIVERTEGNPLFAIQLVGDWVERGILTAGDEGFELREEADRPIPDGPHELWSRRIRQVLEVLAPEEREAGQRSMQLAAALGRHVDADEWRVVCHRAGLPVHRELVARLVEYGLARRESGGWSFVHSMLAESLARQAKRDGVWARYQGLCAAAIQELYPDPDAETVARRAEHLLEADELEAALDPLLQAAREARMLGDYREHHQWIDRRSEILDRLGVQGADRRRVQNGFERAQYCINVGESDRARAILERLEGTARDNRWHRELGDVLRLEAQIARDDGDLQKCLDLADEADERFQKTNYFLGRARCQTTRAKALGFLGKREAARDAFQLAKSIFEALEYPVEVVRTDAWINYTYIYDGDYQESRARARETLDRARDVGDKYTEGDAWNQLGECARFEREWGEARRYYQRAAREYDQIGFRGVYLARMNMAMVEIPAGRFERARRELSELVGSLEEVGWRSRLPQVYTGLLAAAAGLGDWEEFDELAEQVEQMSAAQEGFSKDTAWLAEHAARLAVERGKHGRAEEVYRKARELWTHLDDVERVREIDRVLERLADEAPGDAG
jgi:serine/threonine protein kinase/tetratricopeptide (TPR) repeat protein